MCIETAAGEGKDRRFTVSFEERALTDLRDADDGRQAVPKGDTAETVHSVQKEAFIKATAIKEGIQQQLPGALLREQAERTHEFGETETGAELPEDQDTTEAEERRQESFARLFPPQGQPGGAAIVVTGADVGRGCHGKSLLCWKRENNLMRPERNQLNGLSEKERLLPCGAAEPVAHFLIFRESR
jgi:hypothetical protein